MGKFVPELSAALEASLCTQGIAVYPRARTSSYDEAAKSFRIEHRGALQAMEGMDFVLAVVGPPALCSPLGYPAAGEAPALHRGSR